MASKPTATSSSSPSSNTANTDTASGLPQGFSSHYSHYAAFPRSADGMYASTESQNAALPATMKALVLRSRTEPMTVEAGYATPQAGPGSAVVRVLASNILSYMGDVYTGRRPYPFPTPLVPGVSGVGRVAAVGPDATALRAGQLVWIDATVRSRDSPVEDMMLSGLASGQTPGSAHLMEVAWRDSTFAQFARMPLENLFALDEARLLGGVADGGLGLTTAHLAGMSRLAVPFGGLDDIGIGPGETIIVAPASGPFGSAAAVVAAAMGARRVVALGRNMERLEALAQGVKPAGRIVPCRLSNEPEVDAAALAEALGGLKADAFFDISPPEAADSTHLVTCIQALRVGGRVSFMGGIGGNVQLPYKKIMRGNLTIRGTWMYSPEQARRLIKIVEAGIIDLTSDAISKEFGRFKLEEWKEAFEWAGKNAFPGANAIFEPWE